MEVGPSCPHPNIGFFCLVLTLSEETDPSEPGVAGNFPNGAECSDKGGIEYALQDIRTACSKKLAYS